jgi:hypothetical protein
MGRHQFGKSRKNRKVYFCKKQFSMPTIEVKPKVQVTLNEILAAISKLDTREMEAFFNQVGTLLAHRKTSHLSEKEFQLLAEINKGLPPEHRLKYLQLKDKSHRGNLTKAEYKEFLAMSGEIERTGVRRLECLVELSRLRRVELKELMNQLGIKAPLAYG